MCHYAIYTSSCNSYLEGDSDAERAVVVQSLGAHLEKAVDINISLESSTASRHILLFPSDPLSLTWKTSRSALARRLHPMLLNLALKDRKFVERELYLERE